MKIYKTTFLFSINVREIVTGGKIKSSEIKSKNTGCCSNYVSNMYISLCVNLRRSIEFIRDKSLNIQNKGKKTEKRKIENERKKYSGKDIKFSVSI